MPRLELLSSTRILFFRNFVAVIGGAVWVRRNGGARKDATTFVDGVNR
jgi:hypothetical protein